MTSRAGQLWLTAVCLLFGVLLMIQFRTQGKIAKSLQTESSTDQAQIIGNLYDANIALRNEVASLARQLEQQRDEAAPGRVSELTADLEKLRVVNGTAPTTGPGVKLTIAADVRIEDVQDLVNELRNAGAEAVALNGGRITARSALRSDRGQVVLNDRRVVAPYVFEVIGSPEILERAITRKGGLLSYLQNTYPDGQIAIRKAERLDLPAAETIAVFRLAQPERSAG
ncbi:MAG TPA: DUF881 domain-containing protein [Chloroflexota bacterium]|jgi:uncharacterized protein YlxW (UPF0749 family)